MSFEGGEALGAPLCGGASIDTNLSSIRDVPPRGLRGEAVVLPWQGFCPAPHTVPKPKLLTSSHTRSECHAPLFGGSSPEGSARPCLVSKVKPVVMDLYGLGRQGGHWMPSEASE